VHIRWLAQHPEERRQLVQDKSRIPSAVEEILRFESPVPSGMRFCDQEDIDLARVWLFAKAKRSMLSGPPPTSTECFEDPMKVDFRRRNNHIAFASGVHRCLGSHLARLEMRLALEEFLAASRLRAGSGRRTRLRQRCGPQCDVSAIVFEPHIGAEAERPPPPRIR